jgi:hypothetical protein
MMERLFGRSPTFVVPPLGRKRKKIPPEGVTTNDYNTFSSRSTSIVAGIGDCHSQSTRSQNPSTALE